jgi:DNA-directed RNA polymerase specialized sigma24 family protein
LSQEDAMSEAKVRGPRTQFRPKDARASLWLSTVAKRQWKAARRRTGESASDVVEMLLRQHGGALAAVRQDVAERPSAPPGTTVTLTRLAEQVMLAASARTGASPSDVVEQLLENHGGTVVFVPVEEMTAAAGG